MNELPLSSANALASLLTPAASSLSSSLQEHLHKASGIDGLENYVTKPSSEVPIFEANSDIFCVKSTDSANNVTGCRYFAFQEISREEAMQKISPYIMKGELESVKEDLRSFIKSEFGSLKEELLNAKQPIRNNQSNRFENTATKQSSAIRNDFDTSN